MGCFWAKWKFQNDVGGYTCTKIFYVWNSVTSLLGGPICKITNFGDPPCGLEHYFAEKRLLQKMDTYEQKLQLRVWNFKNQVFPKIVSQCFRRRRRGIHTLNFFIIEIRLLCNLKDTFAKLWFLTTNAAPCRTIVRWHHFLCKNTAFKSGEKKKKCHSVNTYTHESRRSSKNSNALLNLSVHHCCFEKMPAKAAGRGITSYI